MIKTLRIGIGYEIMRATTKDKRAAGKWLRRTLESSGPTYIKIGQFIGNRPDLFGKEVSEEVSKLQNQTTLLFNADKPTSVHKMDVNPVASASIAQVHRGKLKDGRVVAVKIKRPNVNEQLTKELGDIRVAFELSKILNSEFTLLTHWFGDFEKTVLAELDFKKEVDNIQFFSDMYRDSEIIRVPRVLKELSGEEHIVMEYIHSDPIKTCKNPVIVSENLMNTFIEQILYNGVIHGDLHAGNLGVLDKSADLSEKIVMYDFGNVIRIPEFYQKAMRRVLVACQNRNSRALLDAMTDMGMKIRDAKAAKSFADKFFVYLDTLDPSSFAYTQEDIMVPIELDTITMTIIRTHSLVEGICKELYPQFNYESLIQQNIELLMIEQFVIELKKIHRHRASEV